MKWTIKKKLVLAFMLTAVVPIIAISLILRSVISDYSRESFETSSEEQLTHIGSIFTMFFSEIKNQTKTLANHHLLNELDETITSYTGTTKSMYIDHMAKGGIEADTTKLLRLFHHNNPNLSEAFLGMENGGYISSIEAELPAGFDPRVRPWYKLCKADPDRTHMTAPFRSTTGEAVITVTRAIKGKDEKMIGAVAIAVNLTSMTEMINNIKLGETGHAMLIDRDGTIIADPKHKEFVFKNIGEVEDKTIRKIASLKDGTFDLRIDGKNYLATHHTTTHGTKYVGFMEKSEVMAGVNHVLWLISIVAVVLGLLFVVIGIFLANSISGRIGKISDIFKDIAQGEGDLTVRVDFQGSDELMDLATYFNEFIEKIENLIVSIRNSAEMVLSSSSEVAGGNAQLSGSTQEMASSLEETAASVEEITSSITDSAETSAETAASVSLTAKSAENGSRMLREMSEAMDELKTSGERIQEIVTVVNDIAFQTNLLALNAAVEAARAGEEGKGFAVVAGEVRSLAARSAEAASEIRDLVEQNESNISSANNLSHRTVEVLMKVVQSISSASGSVGEIEQKSREQASGIKQINSAVLQMDEVTQRNAALVEELASAAEELKTVAQGLMGEVDQFRVSEKSFMPATKKVAQTFAVPISKSTYVNEQVPTFSPGEPEPDMGDFEEF